MKVVWKNLFLLNMLTLFLKKGLVIYLFKYAINFSLWKFHKNFTLFAFDFSVKKSFNSALDEKCWPSNVSFNFGNNNVGRLIWVDVGKVWISGLLQFPMFDCKITFKVCECELLHWRNCFKFSYTWKSDWLIVQWLIFYRLHFVLMTLMVNLEFVSNCNIHNKIISFVTILIEKYMRNNFTVSSCELSVLIEFVLTLIYQYFTVSVIWCTCS